MLAGYFGIERPKRNMKLVVGALVVVAVIGAFAVLRRPEPSLALQQYQIEEAEFEGFIERFDKFYATEEEKIHRFKIFRDNMAYIRVFNSLGKSWTLGVNHFTDLTGEEFKRMYTGLSREPRERNEQPLEGIEYPASVDWRTKGVVTGVKNQGQCGSCWAFSTTGSVEGAWALAGHTLVSLSEQQLVDCSGSYGNYGCSGGLMDNAFKYIMAHGITSEANYPYTARNGRCNKSRVSDVVAKISSYRDVTHDNPTALKEAIVQQPVSVAVEADQAAWQSYSGGVVSRNCGTNLDHGVLAVGYDDSASTPYYIVKNSWGSGWGMAGYIEIAITTGPGVCGIQMEPSYPIV